MRYHLELFHENFWRHFDKILLAALFMFVYLVTTFLTHSGNMDEGSLDWGRQTGNLIVGALLGVVTGKLLAEKPADKDLPPIYPPDPKQ